MRDKNDKDGRGNCGGECGDFMTLTGRIKEQSLAILSLKKSRKVEASCEGELHVGRQRGILRDSRESSDAHYPLLLQALKLGPLEQWRCVIMAGGRAKISQMQKQTRFF
jgi:hypothetical protein